MFEKRCLIHEYFECFGAISGLDDNFVESVGEGRVFGRNFEEFLIVHDENHANFASFDNGCEKIADINRAWAFFEEEVGVVETKNDVFGRIYFVEDFDHEILKLVLITGGGD